MGSVCSLCVAKKSYSLVILGPAEGLKRRVFSRVSGAEEAVGEGQRYEERRVRLHGRTTIVCLLDNDRMTADLQSIHVNCANGCLFVCSPGKEERAGAEREFEAHFGRKLAQDGFGVLVLVDGPASGKPVLELHRRARNVCVVHVWGTAEEMCEAIDEGVEWLMETIEGR